MKSLRDLALVALCCAALAACGGGGSTPSTSPAASPSSGERHVRSGGCTPDSYGYCVVFLGKVIIQQFCPFLGTVQNTTWRWELYYQGADQGTYTHAIDNCQGTDTWDPDEPSVATGDPNLP